MLADVDSLTYGLDPSSVSRCLDTAAAEGDPVRALIAVHLYGHPVDLDALQEICSSNGIFLVEDGSQAHGARWNGERVGRFGIAAGFSLYPTKNLGALGDAGVITCHSRDQAARLKRLRQYGWDKPAISEEPGINSRLDPLQAAILRVKLPLLEAQNNYRQEIAAVYYEQLKDIDELLLPVQHEGAESVFHQFVVQLPQGSRDRIRGATHPAWNWHSYSYPRAAHQMPAYRDEDWVSIDPKGLTATEALIHVFYRFRLGHILLLSKLQNRRED